MKKVQKIRHSLLSTLSRESSQFKTNLFFEHWKLRIYIKMVSRPIEILIRKYFASNVFVLHITSK